MIKTIQPKRFQDADVTIPYITYTKLNHIVKYKIFNNQIEINLKDIIDRVLVDAGVTGFDTKQMLCTIPYDIKDIASGDTITLIIDKRRFHVRLPEFQIVSNKQQKIDWDNTHPHRWSIAQWVKFIEKLFWDTYGFESVELNLRGKEGAVRTGKVYNRVKTLINKIKAINSLECDESSVVEFLVWVFSDKKKLSLNLGLITCDTMVQEWVMWKKNKLKNELETNEKWK